MQINYVAVANRYQRGYIDNISGHYKPSTEKLIEAVETFQKNGLTTETLQVSKTGL